MKYDGCMKHGRHGGRPFTCRACGVRACWRCALHYWPERVLPRVTGGLGKLQAAIGEAEKKGLLLGCCSRTCRAKLPRTYAADYVKQ